jgi:hypothetical protein
MDFREKLNKRIFIRKVMTGVNCRLDEKLRIFVLTESDEALAKGYNFTLKFKHLIAFLRKKFSFEYCCVIHRQGDKKRINAHVLYYGSYIDKNVIEDWWFKNYDSHRSKMELVRNALYEAVYVAKYLKGEQFISARFSSQWVFPGWWEFCKWFKHEFLSYPTEDMIRQYHLMSASQLDNDTWYSLWLDHKVKTGRMAHRVDLSKRKIIPLYERVLKPDEYQIISKK